MKDEIKRLHSPDIPNLETFHPSDKEAFAFLLQVMVGVKDEAGEESFDIFVCTPKWLLMNHKKDEVLFGKHQMIVFEYNYDAIVKKLQVYIDDLEGENWAELAEKINLIGKWEFWGYRE